MNAIYGLAVALAGVWGWIGWTVWREHRRRAPDHGVVTRSWLNDRAGKWR